MRHPLLLFHFEVRTNLFREIVHRLPPPEQSAEFGKLTPQIHNQSSAGSSAGLALQPCGFSTATWFGRRGVATCGIGSTCNLARTFPFRGVERTHAIGKAAGPECGPCATDGRNLHSQHPNSVLRAIGNRKSPMAYRPSSDSAGRRTPVMARTKRSQREVSATNCRRPAAVRR